MSGVSMAAGRHIHDHSFFAGKGGKDSVFPKGNHTMSLADKEPAEKLREYQDNVPAIDKMQKHSHAQLEKHSQHAGMFH